MAASIVTPARLRELQHYEPEAGSFTWRVSRGRNAKDGDIAGCCRIFDGYSQICIDGKRYLAHRLAWLYVHGEWPKEQIDHINGVRNDNRIANLRDVPSVVNQQNHRKAHASSKSTGLLGAHRNEKLGCYQSAIRLDGRQRYLGIFSTAEEAHDAYIEAKRIHHEGCTI